MPEKRDKRVGSGMWGTMQNKAIQILWTTMRNIVGILWSRTTLRQIIARSTQVWVAVAILKYHPVEPRAPRVVRKNQNCGHVCITSIRSVGALSVMTSVVCGKLSGIVRSQNSRPHLDSILQATERNFTRADS